MISIVHFRNHFYRRAERIVFLFFFLTKLTLPQGALLTTEGSPLSPAIFFSWGKLTHLLDGLSLKKASIAGRWLDLRSTAIYNIRSEQGANEGTAPGARHQVKMSQINCILGRSI